MKFLVTKEDWLRIGKGTGWLAKDLGPSRKLDTQLFPECVGTDEDRDVVGKHRKKHQKKQEGKS